MPSINSRLTYLLTIRDTHHCVRRRSSSAPVHTVATRGYLVDGLGWLSPLVHYWSPWADIRQIMLAHSCKGQRSVQLQTFILTCTELKGHWRCLFQFLFLATCARLSCILSFRVHVKLFYPIVSYRSWETHFRATGRHSSHSITCHRAPP